MGARFTHGDSIESTRKISRLNNTGRKEPLAKSHSGLSHHNTMTGMPGYIDGSAETALHHAAKGGKGSGPKREGDIGKHGSSGVRSMDRGEKPGTVARNYKSETTAKAGPVKSNQDKTPHVHSHNVAQGAGGSHKGPPSSHGKIPGGGKAAGMGASHSGTFGTGQGHRGRMESLRGRGRTAAEGRRKSVMY